MVHKMSAWWGFMILLGCNILPTLQSACNDRLRTVCVPVGGHAIVPCPNSSAEQVSFSLFKAGENVHCHLWNRGENSTGQSGDTAGLEYASAGSDSFAFKLVGVNASSHGIYRCAGTVMYPPPLREIPSDLGILLLLEGHQCNTVVRIKKKKEEQSSWLSLILAVVMSCYSVFITGILIATWVKRRKKDSQSDYINTNPNMPPRNKRTLYNPKPRYFYAP